MPEKGDETLDVSLGEARRDLLMSAEDYESWQETVYLLRSPANARRLMEAVARDKAAATAATKPLDGPDHYG
ncbi:type II toxin-antitoxin system Phd/YefM family antitoxin [Streptomyces sp. NPDC003435]